jgi:pyridoxine 5-phosphate synthase
MRSAPIALGVNIDHVATLRQARRARDPDPVYAALAAEQAGADGIAVHLREDRRHVQDADIEGLAARVRTRLTLEIAATEEMLAIARRVRPADVCLMRETRGEITTEGGLDARAQLEHLRESVALLQAGSIRVAVFVDPDPGQIEAVAQAGASVVDLHTGCYAAARGAAAALELERLRVAARLGASLGLEVHAGHGLDYQNVQSVVAIPEIVEINIGHALIARALFAGMDRAVRDMRARMLAARGLIG